MRWMGWSTLFLVTVLFACHVTSEACKPSNEIPAKYFGTRTEGKHVGGEIKIFGKHLIANGIKNQTLSIFYSNEIGLVFHTNCLDDKTVEVKVQTTTGSKNTIYQCLIMTKYDNPSIDIIATTNPNINKSGKKNELDCSDRTHKVHKRTLKRAKALEQSANVNIPSTITIKPATVGINTVTTTNVPQATSTVTATVGTKTATTTSQVSTSNAHNITQAQQTSTSTTLIHIQGTTKPTFSDIAFAQCPVCQGQGVCGCREQGLASCCCRPPTGQPGFYFKGNDIKLRDKHIQTDVPTVYIDGKTVLPQGATLMGFAFFVQSPVIKQSSAVKIQIWRQYETLYQLVWEYSVELMPFDSGKRKQIYLPDAYRLVLGANDSIGWTSAEKSDVISMSMTETGNVLYMPIRNKYDPIPGHKYTFESVPLKATFSIGVYVDTRTTCDNLGQRLKLEMAELERLAKKAYEDKSKALKKIFLDVKKGTQHKTTKYMGIAKSKTANYLQSAAQHLQTAGQTLQSGGEGYTTFNMLVLNIAAVAICSFIL